MAILRRNRIKAYVIRSRKDDLIIAYKDIINSHGTTIIKKKGYRKSNLHNKIILHYLKFSKIYKNKLLNSNVQINSSINNLFFRFYDVPRISNYYQIKKYLADYKVRSKKLVYDKQIASSKNTRLAFNKNYKNNLLIDISKFVSMYGLR